MGVTLDSGKVVIHGGSVGIGDGCCCFDDCAVCPGCLTLLIKISEYGDKLLNLPLGGSNTCYKSCGVTTHLLEDNQDSDNIVAIHAIRVKGQLFVQMVLNPGDDDDNYYGEYAIVDLPVTEPEEGERGSCELNGSASYITVLNKNTLESVTAYVTIYGVMCDASEAVGSGVYDRYVVTGAPSNGCEVPATFDIEYNTTDRWVQQFGTANAALYFDGLVECNYIFELTCTSTGNDNVTRYEKNGQCGGPEGRYSVVYSDAGETGDIYISKE